MPQLHPPTTTAGQCVTRAAEVRSPQQPASPHTAGAGDENVLCGRVDSRKTGCVLQHQTEGCSKVEITPVTVTLNGSDEKQAQAFKASEGSSLEYARCFAE